MLTRRLPRSIRRALPWLLLVAALPPALGVLDVRRRLARARRQTPLDPLTLVQAVERAFDPVLALDGALNLRDVGGLRTADGRYVRRGRVYRSGALASLSERDLAQLRACDIRHVFDLRTSAERRAAPDRVPTGAQYHRTPLQGPVGRWRTLFALLRHLDRMDALIYHTYERLLNERYIRSLATVLRTLAAEDGTPAIIHCTAGKDRTGIAIAVLLALLGVPERVIIADYSLSNRYVDAFRTALAPELNGLRRFGILPGDVHALLLAQPKILEAVFAYIHVHDGTVEAWVKRRLGLDDATVAQLRQRLLADTDG